MTSPINGDALAAMIDLADKQVQEKIVLDVIFKHDIGCVCAMCESIRSRFPSADADHPDRFAEQGGEHQTYPFDATNLTSLQSIAKSLGSIAVAADRISDALGSARDILRGRDSENKVVNGPLRAIADFLLRGQGQQQTAKPPTAPPQTQRNPVQQQLPMQQPPAQQKRIATEQEMSGERGDPKVRFDVKRNWTDLGKPSFKGRKSSECDPDFLDLYADGLDYFAGEAQKKINSGDQDPKLKDAVRFDSLDAARVRGWAQRIRTVGYKPAPVIPPYAGGGDYD